jgi:hypothetical protein
MTFVLCGYATGIGFLMRAEVASTPEALLIGKTLDQGPVAAVGRRHGSAVRQIAGDLVNDHEWGKT